MGETWKRKRLYVTGTAALLMIHIGTGTGAAASDDAAKPTTAEHTGTELQAVSAGAEQSAAHGVGGNQAEGVNTANLD